MRDLAGQPDEALGADLVALFTHLDREDPGDDVDALVLVSVDMTAGAGRARRYPCITQRHSVTQAAISDHSPGPGTVSGWSGYEWVHGCHDCSTITRAFHTGHMR